VYRVTITRLSGGHDEAVYFPIEEYEVKGEALTLAFDDKHDLVVPLHGVKTVDIIQE
jgi:hypothetical protein